MSTVLSDCTDPGQMKTIARDYLASSPPKLAQIPLVDAMALAWGIAEAKGFHEGKPTDRETTLVRLCLLHSEVSEAVQEIKRHGMDGTEDCLRELADVVIRVGDLVGMLGATGRFPWILCDVMRANLARPDMYGTPGVTSTTRPPGSSPTPPPCSSPS
jgi:NTP pyrophosphatase (non-canonical NTP hydrolase)